VGASRDIDPDFEPVVDHLCILFDKTKERLFEKSRDLVEPMKNVDVSLNLWYKRC
jgi:hypothetical protein